MIRSIFYILFSISCFIFISCHDDYSSFDANQKPVFKKNDMLFYQTDKNRIDTFLVTSFSDEFDWHDSYHAYLEELDVQIEISNVADTSMFTEILFSHTSEFPPWLQLIKNGKTSTNLLSYSSDTIFPNMTINNQVFTFVKYYSLRKNGTTYSNLYFNYQYGILSIETNGRVVYLAGIKHVK